MAAINVLWLILAFFGSYLSGSLPFSVWIGTLATGRDLRKYNIGNPGGFNAIVTYGPKIGLSILFLDMLKGALPMAIIDHVFSLDYFVAPNGTNIWHTLACILGPMICVLGHNYPVWLKFRGGLGGAVFMGTMIYVNPIVYLTYMLTFGLFVGGLKFSSRITDIITGFAFIPAALFMPIGPPWNNLTSDWVAGAGGFLHLTVMFIALAMWLSWLPKRVRSIIIFLKGGKEWEFSFEEGPKMSDEYLDTIKEPSEAYEAIEKDKVESSVD